MSKDHYGWMIAAMVLFLIDTLAFTEQTGIPAVIVVVGFVVYLIVRAILKRRENS